MLMSGSNVYISSRVGEHLCMFSTHLSDVP